MFNKINNLLDAQLIAMNKSNILRRMKVKDAVYLTSFENSSVSLQCEIKSYPVITDNVVWYFYQLNESNNQQIIINKIRLSDWTSSIKTILNQTEKRYYSELTLSNLTSNHAGYYSCSFQSILIDDLNHTKHLDINSTYFLQIKCKS